MFQFDFALYGALTQFTFDVPKSWVTNLGLASDCCIDLIPWRHLKINIYKKFIFFVIFAKIQLINKPKIQSFQCEHNHSVIELTLWIRQYPMKWHCSRQYLHREWHLIPHKLRLFDCIVTYLLYIFSPQITCLIRTIWWFVYLLFRFHWDISMGILFAMYNDWVKGTTVATVSAFSFK